MKGILQKFFPAANKIDRISAKLFSIFCLFLIIWLSFTPVIFYENCSTIIIISMLAVLLFSLSARKFNFNFPDLLVVLFLAASFFSLFWVKNRQSAEFYFIGFILPGPILYFLFKNEFVLMKQKRQFFALFGFCALIVAIFGIIEFFAQKNLLYEKLVVNKFYYFFQFQGRAMSTQQVPHVLGVFLGALLPFFYNLIFAQKQKTARLIAVMMTLLIGAGIFVSFTRGVFLAVFVASLFYAYFKNQRMWRYIILVFCALILSSTLVSQFIPSSSFSAPFYRFSFNMLIDSSSRTKNWEKALLMAKDHPFVGVGVGQYRTYYDLYDSAKTQDYAKIADNMYLTILAEGGIFAFLFFLLLIFILLRGAWKYARLKKPDADLALALSSGMIVILISMVYFDALYWVVPLFMFWVYCGILASLTGKMRPS